MIICIIGMTATIHDLSTSLKTVVTCMVSRDRPFRLDDNMPATILLLPVARTASWWEGVGKMMEDQETNRRFYVFLCVRVGQCHSEKSIIWRLRWFYRSVFYHV